MQSKLLHEAGGQRTFAVILATGDEALSSLQEFVQRENIHAATLTAIGALSAAVLNYFNWEKKEYEKIPVREQVEVAALIGDVADDPHSGRKKSGFARFRKLGRGLANHASRSGLSAGRL